MRIRRVQRVLAVLIASGVASTLALAMGSGQKVSAPGHYSGYSPRLYEEWVRTSFYVEARDGVRLAMTLYRPAVHGVAVTDRYPPLLSFTPYRRLYRGPDGKLEGLGEGERGERERMADMALHGYVVAIADVRGKGASFGVRSAYQDENEARDAYDLVEWLAAQPWATDKVGMFGCSYYAGTQLAAARMNPPNLRAIFPEAGPFDAYRMVSKGGISGQFNTRYQSNDEDIGVVPVDADLDGTLAEQARKQHSANGQMLDIITKMPYRDDRDPSTDIPYWRIVSPYEHADTFKNSGIAIYLWANWFDEVSDQSFISYSTLKSNPRKLLIGSGTHCDVGPIDTLAEHLRFFDRYLKNIDNGIDREPPIYYRTINAPADREWQFSDVWPPKGVRAENWSLTSKASRSLVKTAFDGSLSATGSRRGRASFSVDYNVGCTVEERFNPGVGKPKPGEEGKPQPGYWPCVLDDIGATFTSAPLADTTTLTGTPVVDLRLTADKDVNVFAYLELVPSSGPVEIISHGRLKASARKESSPPYDNLGLPWHSNRRTDSLPVDPREVMRMAIELSPTSIVLPAGSRLRLTLTGADLRQRNLETIQVSPPPRLTVLTGMDGSSIRLPVMERR